MYCILSFHFVAGSQEELLYDGIFIILGLCLNKEFLYLKCGAFLSAVLVLLLQKYIWRILSSVCFFFFFVRKGCWLLEGLFIRMGISVIQRCGQWLWNDWARKLVFVEDGRQWRSSYFFSYRFPLTPCKQMAGKVQLKSHRFFISLKRGSNHN